MTRRKRVRPTWTLERRQAFAQDAIRRALAEAAGSVRDVFDQRSPWQRLADSISDLALAIGRAAE